MSSAITTILLTNLEIYSRRISINFINLILVSDCSIKSVIFNLLICEQLIFPCDPEEGGDVEDINSPFEGAIEGEPQQKTFRGLDIPL